MPRLSVDTNVLIYSIDRSDPRKHNIANAIIESAERIDAILTLQVIGEFINASRKRAAPSDTVSALVASWLELFQVASTDPLAILPAFDRSRRFDMQFWDALIVEVCVTRQVTHFLTEDLQDGQEMDGLTIVNPFSIANEDKLLELLPAWKDLRP